jgi:T-complex protein 1 subunit beta
LAQTVKGK